MSVRDLKLKVTQDFRRDVLVIPHFFSGNDESYLSIKLYVLKQF